MPLIAKIVSDRQTGADRAALYFVLQYGIPRGGYPQWREFNAGRVFVIDLLVFQ